MDVTNASPNPFAAPPTVSVTKGAYWFQVTVTAAGATKVSVEREINSVVQTVEGAADILPVTDTFDVYDYMAMQRVIHKYRATRYDPDPLDGGKLKPTHGNWVATTDSEYLDFGGDVMFDAANPSIRTAVVVEGIDAMKRSVNQSVVSVIGRPDPLVVSSVRRWPAGTIRLLTLTDEDRRALVTLLGQTNIVAFSPRGPGYGFDYVPFFAIGDVDESRPSTRGYEPARRWSLSVQQVAAPRLMLDNIGDGDNGGGGGDNGGGGDTTPPGTRVWRDYSSTKKWTDLDHTDWQTVAGL